MIIAIYSEKTRPVRCLSASKLTVHTKKRKKKKRKKENCGRDYLPVRNQMSIRAFSLGRFLK